MVGPRTMMIFRAETRAASGKIAATRDGGAGYSHPRVNAEDNNLYNESTETSRA
jgi:hypothetical protein